MINLKFIRPKKISESDIKCEIYRQLKNAGIECYTEYRGDKASIFDIIIVRDGNIDLIVECKNLVKDTSPDIHTKQLDKYYKFNTNILLARRYIDIPVVVKFILEEEWRYHPTPCLFWHECSELRVWNFPINRQYIYFYGPDDSEE